MGHQNTVFVSGLPQTDFDEDAFRRRFEDCGKIRYVWLPERCKGENKGFGTIAYKTEEGFQKALKYNGTKCKGNVLSVTKSQPKKQKAKEGDANASTEKEVKSRETSNGDSKALKQAAEAAERTPKRKIASIDENTDDGSTNREKKKRKSAPEEPLDEQPRKGKSERKAAAL